MVAWDGDGMAPKMGPCLGPPNELMCGEFRFRGFEPF